MLKIKKSDIIYIFNKYIPRNETVILVIGLILTLLAKSMVLFKSGLLIFSFEIFKIFLPDILFFLSIFLFIRCFYLIKPSILNARISFLISCAVLSWSIFNSIWLLAEKVQLQSGVLFLMLKDIQYLWPYIKCSLSFTSIRTSLAIFFAISLSAYFIWAFIKSGEIKQNRKYHLKIALSLLVMILLLLPFQIILGNRTSNPTTEMLNFSSHWYAVKSIFAPNNSQKGLSNINIIEEGRREIFFNQNVQNKPNVIIIMLESASYSATSLSNPELKTTPFLKEIAQNGVEFSTTRVPASHTTKCIWAALTGTDPIVDSDYTESVPVQKRYESLATILKKAGYRSAFFEMSKGSFECAPGLFDNLGFDYAWFRENSNDPSSHLGYMSGNDLKMIEPAVNWATSSNTPFLLTIITSVSHDPYELPKGFGQNKEEPYDRYLETLKYTDFFLKQLWSAVKEKNIDRNTILCVIGDHGTSFRNTAGKGRWIPNEEVLRVPWIIYWPQNLKSGQIINWPCSQIDVTPTILSLMGFDISKCKFEGRNAFEQIEQNRKLFFYSWYENSPIGFIENNMKVVYWPCLDKIFQYDLSVDPNEINPKTISNENGNDIINQINEWKNKKHITINAKNFTGKLLFNHWQTFSIGSSAWAYYVSE